MMSQQDLPTLFYSGSPIVLFQLYLKVNYKQLQLNHGLKFPKKGLQLEGLNFDRQGQLFFIGCIRRQYFQNQS